MSVTVVLEFEAQPDKVAAVRELFRKLLPDTRAYEGFESLTVHQNQEHPSAFPIWEHWATRQQYEAYLAWRTETGALGDLGAMLTGPPSIRFFDFVDV